jgi:hypothetical protein
MRCAGKGYLCLSVLLCVPCADDDLRVILSKMPEGVKFTMVAGETNTVHPAQIRHFSERRSEERNRHERGKGPRCQHTVFTLDAPVPRAWDAH